MTLTAGDAVWVATAHLHQENPSAADFSAAEVIQRALTDNLSHAQEQAIRAHVYWHCVANVTPQPQRLRMLHATEDGRRRLHRAGDPQHPLRSSDRPQRGRRITPERTDLPPDLQPLLEWYASTYAAAERTPTRGDPLLELRGSGTALWHGEPADEYLRRLRESWA
jgi:hypothetical protein